MVMNTKLSQYFGIILNKADSLKITRVKEQYFKIIER